jgi:hypothetical protein
VDAVVIGAENAHFFKRPFRSNPWRRMRRLYPSHAAEANPVNSAKIPLNQPLSAPSSTHAPSQVCCDAAAAPVGEHMIRGW